MSECRVTDLDPIPALPYWTLAAGFLLAVKGTRLEVTMNCYCTIAPFPTSHTADSSTSL